MTQGSKNVQLEQRLCFVDRTLRMRLLDNGESVRLLVLAKDANVGRDDMSTVLPAPSQGSESEEPEAVMTSVVFCDVCETWKLLVEGEFFHQLTMSQRGRQ